MTERVLYLVVCAASLASRSSRCRGAGKNRMGMRTGMNGSSTGLFMPTIGYLWYLFDLVIELCTWI
jgi:hypothetical protein